ncbi:MAG: tetratricopeptide repeat protein [Syntrophales bacterium LBB04]|nr:tetratricopeptide repeat protein [Syntrophales bacterium LBB04]
MMNRSASKVIFSALILLYLSSLPLLGADRIDVEQIFGFAESLFEEGDYFRAISEYKRYIYLSPGHDQTDKASVRIAESYFRAGRWPEAIESCSKFIASNPSSPLYYETLYLKGRAEKQDKRYDDAIATFDIIESKKSQNYRDKAIYQKALIMLERADWQGTRDVLILIPPDSVLYSSAESLKAELARAHQLPTKSPASAGFLAAILPGAGHLYTERPKDALVAFLLNSAFIWAAVESFQHDNYAVGGIFTFFELGWYGGNIYSAVSSAHKYNRRQEDDFIKQLKDKFSLALIHGQEGSSLLLSRSF